jgi:hypothetical protein
VSDGLDREFKSKFTMELDNPSNNALGESSLPLQFSNNTIIDDEFVKVGNPGTFNDGRPQTMTNSNLDFA